MGWGSSWGAAWGAAWRSVVAVAPAPTPATRGGGFGGRFNESAEHQAMRRRALQLQDEDDLIVCVIKKFVEAMA